MTIYIAALATDALSNWQICKQRSLWGTRSRRDGRDGSTHMRAVRPGDQAFVWFSKRGVGALMTATGRATERPTQMWPDGATYALALPMVVEKEIAKPITDSFILPGLTAQTYGMKVAWFQLGLYPPATRHRGEDHVGVRQTAVRLTACPRDRDDPRHVAPTVTMMSSQAMTTPDGRTQRKPVRSDA